MMTLRSSRDLLQLDIYNRLPFTRLSYEILRY